MLDFIERLRQKPEHVRRQIAAGTAVTMTGLVALGWVGALAAGNVFILTPVEDAPSLAQTSGELTGAVKDARTSFSDLMGAVNNADGATNEPSLIIVESESSSTLSTDTPKEDTRTVIPF
ncbi:MAG TPA: hypothetical protein VEA92_02545 [Candidatus Paceibacterota bacterium]|nr:hypothetical protein [Candidatus Paceibacterota bacterium]